MSSKIQKTYEFTPVCPAEDATGPLFSVIVAGAGVTPVTSTKKLTVAVEAVLERGKYPIFLANETTFSLKVALSMNTSLVTMLAL